MKALNHRTVVAALAAALLLLAAPAEGKTRRKKAARARSNPACATAYKDASMLELDDQLLAARTKLQLCARPSCGAVQRRCAGKLLRLEAEIPTIVPAASDDAGRPVPETSVRIDGKPLLSRIDGRSLGIDPGQHEFTFETAGTPPASVRTEILRGRRNQAIAAVLHVPDATPPREEPPPRAAPAPPLPPPAPVVQQPVATPPPADDPPPVSRALRTRVPHEPASSSSSVAPTLLTVVGVAGLAGGAAFTYWGRKDNEQLAGCTPNCPAETVHHIRMLYLGADMSFAVGGLALGTAALLWLTSPSPQKERVASSHFGLGVSQGGALASYGGAF